MPEDLDSPYDVFTFDDPESDGEGDAPDVELTKGNAFHIFKNMLHQPLLHGTPTEKKSPPEKIILDVEKLVSFAPEEQEMLLDLFDVFLETSDHQHPEAKSTLLAYDLLTTVDAFHARRSAPVA